MRFEAVKARSLLSKRIDADSWFHSNHSMNIYRGCQFACTYCDGMSERYYVDNFQTHIRVKENAPEVLQRELRKLGYIDHKGSRTLLDYTDSRKQVETRKPIIGISGGVSDSYQQAEQKYKITRRVLKVLLENELPVFLLTKSDLVLRDLDILKSIHERAFANICFSITLNDEKVKQVIEPNSSSTLERFEALREIRRARLYGGVMAMPIIPYIGDSYENMRGLAEEARKAGAEFILFADMTLKPGRQKEHFFNTVRRYFPEKLDLIRAVYADENPYGRPNKSKLQTNVMALGYGICKEVGINDRSVRHRVPREYKSNHHVLRVLLDLTFYMSSLLRKPWSHSKTYHDLAVKVEKGFPNLLYAKERDELNKILGNASDVELVSEILETGSCCLLEQVRGEVNQMVTKEYDRLGRDYSYTQVR